MFNELQFSWGGDCSTEVNKLYNVDCLELMKDIPDKSIDAIITDLPYGWVRLLETNGIQ